MTMIKESYPVKADDMTAAGDVSARIKRQMKQVEQFQKIEKRRIPADIDYDDVGSLRREARQKLKSFRPENLGQASRIQGVSPADISVLLVYVNAMNRAAGKKED